MNVLMADQKRKRALSTSDWSDLPQDLVVSVAKRVIFLLEDFIVFCSICKSWASAVKESKEKLGLRLTYQVPLLMLPVRAPPKNKGRRMRLVAAAAAVEFYSLTKGKIFKLNVPEIMGKECWSSLGWLIISSEDLKVTLLNPFNHNQANAKIELPDGRTYLSRFLESTRKVLLSSSPSWTSDYMVMFFSSSAIGFCRPGLGENWTRVFLETRLIMDLTYYQGEFYVVDLSGRVSVVDIRDPKQPQLRVVAPEIPNQLLGPNPMMDMDNKVLYFVQSAGALLLVLFWHDPQKRALTVGCRVFELPFKNGSSWLDSEVKNLGNRTLFLGMSNSSFFVEASEYCGCKPNCIYFMNNRVVCPTLELDMGVFNMEDGTIDRDFGKSIRSGYEDVSGPHLWIQPSF